MKIFKIKPSVRQMFTALVIFMWASSFLMNMINPKYDPPDYINPLIMLVGGYLFATSTVEKPEKDKKEPNK